jgi:hypothetical protein
MSRLEASFKPTLAVRQRLPVTTVVGSEFDGVANKSSSQRNTNCETACTAVKLVCSGSDSWHTVCKS